MNSSRNDDSTSPCKGEVGRRSEAEAVGRGSPSKFSRTATMTKNARRLRSNPTDVENLLWKALRRDQLDGFNFRRQHPIGRYVLDFYCPAARLAVEVDGGQHGFGAEQKRDRIRDEWLAAQGIRTLRFWNDDVLSNLHGVLETIVITARSKETPSRRKECADLPLSGGGEGLDAT